MLNGYCPWDSMALTLLLLLMLKLMLVLKTNLLLASMQCIAIAVKNDDDNGSCLL